MISDPADIAAVGAAAVRRQCRIAVHLKVDTGMGRLGLLPDSVAALVAQVRAHPGLQLSGLMTHFACADIDDPNDASCMTNQQIRCFAQISQQLSALGLQDIQYHMANSAAVLWFPHARGDLVRCGRALYGSLLPSDHRQWGMPSSESGPRSTTTPIAHLRQAMRLVTRVAQVRDVSADTTVSYGALWRAERPCRLAVLPVGYADGLPRRATGSAQVLIHGQRCPLVGAISMDIVIADVSALGDRVCVGDEVVLLGRGGDDLIATHEFAEWAGITSYEVTCGISKRVPRVYVAGDHAATQSTRGRSKDAIASGELR